MSPERYNLEGYRGDAIAHGFRFLNDDGTPENLTGELLAKRRIEEWCAATGAVFMPFLTVAGVIRPLN